MGIGPDFPEASTGSRVATRGLEGFTACPNPCLLSATCFPDPILSFSAHPRIEPRRGDFAPYADAGRPRDRVRVASEGGHGPEDLPVGRERPDDRAAAGRAHVGAGFAPSDHPLAVHQEQPGVLVGQ